MKEKLKQIIIDSIEEINDLREQKIDINTLDQLVFYGTNGVFSSMGLVNFLSTIEDYIDDELDLQLTLASEKAISKKVSPFSSLSSLIDYITELVIEEGYQIQQS